MRNITFYVDSCECVHSCGVGIWVTMVEREIQMMVTKMLKV